MFAGRGQQSLVLTLTADFRKVRHILFGSGYGAKVNIFKWINYPLLWVESRILILFWFFFFFHHIYRIPPPPWKIQISNFFPKSKSEVADYPPPGKSKFPTFSLSPNPKLQITQPPPPENPNFQLVS